MANIYDVKPEALLQKAAEQLKQVEALTPPPWATFCKTGANKERPPADENWWYHRAASILRKIYMKGPIGVAKLRVAYGSRKNRGHKPDKFVQASGNIIRTIFQQLEKAEFVKQAQAGNHKGRILTPKGKSFLDKIAVQIAKETPRETKVEQVKPKKAKKKEEVQE